MQWLNKIVDELISLHPDGEIVVSSGVSPSGVYHVGTLREVLTAEAVAREIGRRGRKARHLHIVDDHDVFRKVPVGLPENYGQFLGKPLSDIPAPDGSDNSYADYYLKDLLSAANDLHLNLEIVRSQQKYRAGFFVQAIEKALEQKEQIKQILENISGHKVDENWSPVQVLEEGYLKNRPLTSFNKDAKTLVYKDKDDQERTNSYANGDVKLNWRVDWPARWWLLGVQVEPFGRDHATKGGSFDTGEAIAKEVYETTAPLPVPYNFIMRTGDTKKMSKSAGDTITVAELLTILPAEVVWFFIIRYAPDKQLFFDEGPTLTRLMDEFGELLAKKNKTDSERQLMEICLQGIDHPTVSRVPFSLLTASYQAALKNPERTLETIGRTEYSEVAQQDAEIIKSELKFIDAWLAKSAPEDLKFSLLDSVDAGSFTDSEKDFLAKLAVKIEQAPEDADGQWFHLVIYSLRDESGLEPKEMFQILYKALIGKQSGPRAGWFLSILPHDWLINRLKLEA